VGRTSIIPAPHCSFFILHEFPKHKFYQSSLMYRSIDPTEDIVLKQVITDRFALPPADRLYLWRDVLPKEKRAPISDIIVTRGNAESHFSLEDVADAIGDSLADLLIARSEDEKSIFSDVNPSLFPMLLTQSPTRSPNRSTRAAACVSPNPISTCSSKRPCSRTKLTM